VGSTVEVGLMDGRNNTGAAEKTEGEKNCIPPGSFKNWIEGTSVRRELHVGLIVLPVGSVEGHSEYWKCGCSPMGLPEEVVESMKEGILVGIMTRRPVGSLDGREYE